MGSFKSYFSALNHKQNCLFKLWEVLSQNDVLADVVDFASHCCCSFLFLLRSGCAALRCAVSFCLVQTLLHLFCLTKALLPTADQRQWLQDKGGEKQKGQSKSGPSLQPGSSLTVAQEQSVARHRKRDSNARMKVGEAAAATADYAEPDRYEILFSLNAF